MPITYLDSRSDPRRDEWQTKILRALNNVPLARLVKLSGLSRSTLIGIRAGPQQAASQKPGDAHGNPAEIRIAAELVTSPTSGRADTARIRGTGKRWPNSLVFPRMLIF
jgi:hypothetical protein